MVINLQFRIHEPASRLALRMTVSPVITILYNGY